MSQSETSDHKNFSENCLMTVVKTLNEMELPNSRDLSSVGPEFAS